MYLKGIYKKLIYNRDNYYVGLIKVKDSDYAGLNDKTITFTGYFSNINIDDILILNGEFTKHSKYGEQFLCTSYEVSLPDEQDGIVTFLSSDMFKGIGEAKAKKIYATLGDKTIDIIPSGKLATGDKVTITVGTDTKIYEVVIYGDVNGDGKIAASDYVKIKNNIMGKGTISQ